MRLRSTWLLCVLLVLPVFAHAQFPTPPTESEAIDLCESVRVLAAAQVDPERRQAIADFIEHTEGEAARLYNHSGTALVLQGAPHEALWCFANSALPEADQPDALNNMGLGLTLLGEHSRAERILLYTVENWEDYSGAWVNLGRLYMDTGELDLAEEAVNRAHGADPGSVPAQEAGVRLAIMRDDTRAAADHTVNLSNLDPGNPWISEGLEATDDEEIASEITESAASVPMPGYYTHIDYPIDGDYEAFVLQEVRSPFWGPAAEHFGTMAGTLGYQTATLPPSVFEQLPPDMQATLRSMGAAPGEDITVPSPAATRANYPMLADQMNVYLRRYRTRLRQLYKQSALAALYNAEFDRQRQYSQEYIAAMRAGVPIEGAMNEYCRNAIGSLSGNHNTWLALLEDARARANEATRRYWLTQAGLISLLPEEHQDVEIAYLRKTAAMANVYHTAEVSKWFTIGKRPVLLDRAAAEMATEALHEAAWAREWEAMVASEPDVVWGEGYELETGEGTPLDIDRWCGLNLGVLSVKVQEDQVGVTVGEVLQLDGSYAWDDHEFEVGFGPGVSTPTLGVGPGSIGGSAKIQGVIRLGGPSGAALGIRDQSQINVGTPVAGVDIQVHDHYTTLISAGAPL